MISHNYPSGMEFCSDTVREARIQALGSLICSPASSRLWRIVCMAEQRQLIRERSPEQVALIERRLRAAIDARELHA